VSAAPEHQHYGGFFRLGRYYICGGSEALSGLMSKQAARRLLKRQRYSYGANLRKCSVTPNSRIKIFWSRLMKSG
jgi:hypothetical protein